MAFYDVLFKECKLTGTDFSSCNLFSSFRFGQCQMRYVNFRKMKMIKTSFTMCDMAGADFANANLQGSFFGQCDLSGAMFHNTDLTAADFSIAYNRVVIPGNNKLKNAVFSRFNIEGVVVHLGIKLKD
ncbi:pentapeptide repeat-containing protein [Culturomica massiliensis]|jgi:fluoroquinolone resistance protein|uniref:pentapeptide repeat-containing protein n=1 Tax=Culturomica massiliensis TaxID=1841857 RepID=UPI0011C35752|nr:MULTISPECIES: pentapeptide repeat-containing protein [Odoribacteraceae]